jgi:ubiquinone/menaquinone biosynthesis C-methylase UbiE
VDGAVREDGARKRVAMFHNVYQDTDYAEEYAGLEWGGTYHLVHRDLPGVLREHVTGRRALDFGCGTGRSTRLLRSYGFDVTGADVADSMIRRARQVDPGGSYLLLADGDLGRLPAGSFDLVLAAFPFDNIPGAAKADIFRALGRLLASTGRIVNIVSSPEMYTHEWASFSTRAFPENLAARSGDIVRIVTTAFRHARPCEDVLWDDAAYREVYARAGLELVATYRPLGSADEPVAWVSETEVAPWVVYVLNAKSPEA